jgi:hypothetical protein
LIADERAPSASISRNAYAARPNQQSDDDEDDAVEHGAPRISVTIPPMTKIAAMIHRIVATPPPQSLAAIRKRSMLLSLPTEPIGLTR